MNLPRLFAAIALTTTLATAAETYREPFQRSFPIREQQHLQIKAYAEALLREKTEKALSAVAPDAPIYWVNLGLTRGIDLGFFTLRWYSLAYLAGIVLGYWHLTRMARAPGAPKRPGSTGWSRE